MKRVFVGFRLPSQLIDALETTRGGVESAHWQRDDQLHLTLAFIGEINGRDRREIISQLDGMSFSAPRIALSGVGFFGKPGRPKCLWAGVTERDALNRLHDKISHRLMQIPVPVDQRRFKPHITLARFRRHGHARIGDWLRDHENLSSEPVTIPAITLFSSHRTRDGSYFEEEAVFPASDYVALSDQDSDD